MIKPLILNIQRFSVHDGPGIRTTVFFKGCHLRCWWCHNPESQSYRPDLVFYVDRCVGCGACVAACPHQAIQLVNGKAKTNRQLCQGCGDCVAVCHYGARELVGRQYELNELVNLLVKDEILYEESGGGVTLSGGEVMSQPIEYLTALAKQLHRRGIDVAVDTCGYAPYDHYQRILPYVDTFLYDIKLIDSAKHKHYMALGNERILDNLKRISQAGAKISVRIPVIGKVNADSSAMMAIAKWLIDNQVKPISVHLLPYHNTGCSKYATLGMVYKEEAMVKPTNETMTTLAELFIEQGFSNVKIGG